MSLEPIDAETALKLYLAEKENELSDASLTGHKYRLGHFLRWCDEVEGIENLNTLNGRQLHRYRLWRREDGDLNKVSEKTQMDTLRVFIRWLESIDGVEQDLSQKVLSPSITPDENSRDVMLDSDDASQLLAHLEKYEYASIQHVSIALMWHTMMRVGGVHALDVDDYDPDEQFLKVRHRPDTGTPIKNQGDGERMVALSDGVCDLIDDIRLTSDTSAVRTFWHPERIAHTGQTADETRADLVYQVTIATNASTDRAPVLELRTFHNISQSNGRAQLDLTLSHRPCVCSRSFLHHVLQSPKYVA